MEGVDFASYACIFFTIIMFSAGIPECLRMFRQKSTKNITFLPYLMTDINCASWMLYGRMTKNFTVIFVNAIGCSLQTTYIVVFFMFATEREKEIKQTLIAAVAFLIGYFTLTHVITNSQSSIYLTGLSSCVITILMFASPLSEINTVISKKSTAILSFPLTVASLLCGGSWTVFGIFLKDSFIVIPNVMGVLTSVVRFYLFYKFPAESSVLPV